MLHKFGKRLLKSLGSYRDFEYRVSKTWLEGCLQVLDAGCGTGTFLEHFGNNIQGIDLNPENVEYCISKGLRASVGSVLEIPFENESFDGVHLV